MSSTLRIIIPPPINFIRANIDDGDCLSLNLSNTELNTS